MILRAKKKLSLQYDSTVSFFADALQRMRTHEGFKRYFKNTGWLFFGRMFGLVASFFVGAYVARYLGPEKYGILNYVMGFVGVFAFVSSLGIDGIVSREILKHPARLKEILGTSFAIKLLGGSFSIMLINFTAFIFEHDINMRLFIALYSFMFLFLAFNIIDTFYQSQVLSKKTIRLQIYITLILSVIKLLLIFMRAGLIYFVATLLFESLLLAIGLVLIYQKNKGHILLWRFDKNIAVEMLRDSWPLIFTGAFYLIYMRIDQVLIKHMINNEALGFYSAAVRLAEVWFFIPNIICSSLFPAVMNAKGLNRDLYEGRLKKLYALVSLIAIVIASTMTFFARPIIILLFGGVYLSAVPVLKIYIWSGIAVSIGVVVFQYLIVENFTKIFAYITMIGAMVNIMLNILLIPRYGIIGSAFATLVSYAMVPLSLGFFKSTRSHFRIMVSFPYRLN